MADKQFLKTKLTKEILSQIEKALDGMNHGSVQIIVQNSRIIQIDKIEKIRLDKVEK